MVVLGPLSKRAHESVLHPYFGGCGKGTDKTCKSCQIRP